MEKLFRLIGFIGVVWAINSILVACTPDNQHQEAFQSAQRTDISKMTDVQVDPRKKVLTTSLRVLDQSHQIFNESWGLLFGRGISQPQSIFKVLANRYKLHLVNGSDIKESLGQCPTSFVRLETNDYKKDQRVAFLRLSQVLCDGDREVSSVEMVKFDFLGNGFGRIKLSPTHFKDGLGDSLAILNQQVLCDFEVESTDLIKVLNCSNIGQNRERMIHVKFHQMFYNRRAGDILVVKADQYLNLTQRASCDDTKKPCLLLTVPMDGRIKIVENQMMTPEVKPVTKMPTEGSPEQLKLLEKVSKLAEENKNKDLQGQEQAENGKTESHQKESYQAENHQEGEVNSEKAEARENIEPGQLESGNSKPGGNLQSEVTELPVGNDTGEVVQPQ